MEYIFLKRSSLEEVLVLVWILDVLINFEKETTINRQRDCSKCFSVEDPRFIGHML